jgi:enoyl-CoA hydratase/carnithine racemase
MTLAAAYDHASRVMVENLLAADANEGIRAFIEKRPPVWG